MPTPQNLFPFAVCLARMFEGYQTAFLTLSTTVYDRCRKIETLVHENVAAVEPNLLAEFSLGRSNHDRFVFNARLQRVDPESFAYISHTYHEVVVTPAWGGVHIAVEQTLGKVDSTQDDYVQQCFDELFRRMIDVTGKELW